MNAIDKTIAANGIFFRVILPENPANLRPVVMIHGLTGNEYSMDVIASAFTTTRPVIFPRGVEEISWNSYSWIQQNNPFLSIAEQYTKNAARLEQGLKDVFQSFSLDSREIDVAGFSQGAAMGLALLLHSPHFVHAAACLAGFLPKGLPVENHTLHHRIYFSHGTKDEIVPVELAKESARKLEALGAEITFCEFDGGHKLNAACFKELKSFFD